MSRLRENLARAEHDVVMLTREVAKLRDRSAVRRALAEAEQQVDKLRHSLTEEVFAGKAKKTQIQALELAVRRGEMTIQVEQLKRVSAQRGLVAYMREHGLGDRIGYDPDQDASLAHLREEPAKAKR
jgi:hypothetical protein